MSGSSPESGEFAAKNRIKLGFAVTTLPLATRGGRTTAPRPHNAGWGPDPDDIIYRVGIHVAETDEQALDDLLAAGQPRRRPGLSHRQPERLDDAAATWATTAGTSTTSAAACRSTSSTNASSSGQLLVGSPQTGAEANLRGPRRARLWNSGSDFSTRRPRQDAQGNRIVWHAGVAADTRPVKATTGQRILQAPTCAFGETPGIKRGLLPRQIDPQPCPPKERGFCLPTSACHPEPAKDPRPVTGRGESVQAPVVIARMARPAMKRFARPKASTRENFLSAMYEATRGRVRMTDAPYR